MKKLKVVLITLLALTMSLFLFACHDTGEEGGENTDIGSVTSVSITGQIELTDSQKTKDDFWNAAAKLTAKVAYANSDSPKTLEVNATNFDIDGIDDIIQNDLGVVGNYSLKVLPKENNPNYASANVVLKIDHDWGEAVNGKKTCKGADKATQVVTENVTAKASFKGYFNPVTLTADPNVDRIAMFGTTYKADGTEEEVNTLTFGRLERGMTISVRGTAINTDAGATWNIPCPGFADRNDNGGVVVRNDNWTLFSGIGGNGHLNGWPGSSNAPTAGTLADAQAAGLWSVFSDGTPSLAADYPTAQDIEITWRYVAGTDTTNPVVLFSVQNYTTPRLFTACVTVEDRQAYDTVLHAEYMDFEFKTITVVQMFNLESISAASLKSGAKKAYVENEMFDLSTIDVTAKYEQSETPMAVTSFELWGNTAANAEANAEGWINLNRTPLTSDLKTYKILLQVAEDVKEHVLTGTEFPVTVNANTIADANPNEVKIGGATFTAPTLYGEGTTLPISFGSTEGKTLLTVTPGALGAPLTLSDEMKSALGLSGTYTHYIAFSAYAGHAATRFAAQSGGITVKSGNDVVGKAQIREGNNGALDVVIALNQAVLTAKTVVISGAQTTDIVVDLTAVNVTPSKIEVTSEVEGADKIYVNKDSTVTVTYTFTGTMPGADELMVGIGNNTSGLDYVISQTDGVTYNGLFNMKAVRDETHKTVTVTYTIFKTATEIRSLDFQLLKFDEISGAGSLIVRDDAYFTTDFAEGEGTQIGEYYVTTSNEYLYLVTARDYHNTTTTNNAVHGDLHLQINAGAKTPAKNVSIAYLKTHDLSYAANEAGEIALPGGPLAGLVTARLYVFGTLNNNKDTDKGAILVFTINTAALGYTAADEYSFRLDDANEYYTVAGLAAGAATTVRTISAANTIGELAENHKGQLLGEVGNCATPTNRVDYVGTDLAHATFYTRFASAIEDGNHDWAEEKNADKFYVCTKCGSIMNFKVDDEKETKVNNVTIKNLGEANKLAENGLSVFFKSVNPTGDWDAHALMTAETDLRITLPNLDAFWHTLDSKSDATAEEKALVGKLNKGNFYPTSAGAIMGEGIKGWADGYSAQTVNAAITISKYDGVVYYKNGVMAFTYPAAAAFGNGTVGDFAEAFLRLAAHYGLVVAQSGVNLSNLTVLKGAISAEMVKSFSDTFYPPIVEEEEESEADATATAASIATIASVTGAIQPSENQNPTAQDPIQIGTDDAFQTWTNATPAWAGMLAIGKKTVIKGVMNSNCASQNESWQCPMIYIFDGNNTTNMVAVRTDNNREGGITGANNGYFLHSCNTDASKITGTGEGTDETVKFWNAVYETWKHGLVEYTIDTTQLADDSNDGTAIVVTMKVTNADATQVYVTTHTITINNAWSWWHTTGNHWFGDSTMFGFGGNLFALTINSIEVL